MDEPPALSAQGPAGVSEPSDARPSLSLLGLGGGSCHLLWQRGDPPFLLTTQLETEGSPSPTPHFPRTQQPQEIKAQVGIQTQLPKEGIEIVSLSSSSLSLSRV